MENNFKDFNTNELELINGGGALSSFAGSATAYSAAVGVAISGPVGVLGIGLVGLGVVASSGLLINGILKLA